jgi:hypothetical protein
MKHMISSFAFAGALTLGAVAAQTVPPAAGNTEPLATVAIPVSVMVSGKPVPSGTYEIRLAAGRPAPLAGQSPTAQRWVDFVANGTVVAREAAEVLYDNDLPDIGSSARPVASGTRVEMLKGGEFLRISVKRAAERYLIHLAVAR